MDKFPEAFRRFESDVDVGRFRSYHELTLSFRWWAGNRWKGTARQWTALNNEAENLGFDIPDFIRSEIRESHSWGYYNSEGKQRAITWKRETVNVRGSNQNRYRDIKTGRFIKKP